MSKQGPGQIDREAAERLLRGEFAIPRDETEALVGLLAAAAAPAQAGELAGESAAITAFWEASRSVVPQPPVRAGFAIRLTSFLTVKATAVAVALLAFGGAALAAGTGALPTTLTTPDRGAHRPPARHAVPTTVSPLPTVSPHPVGSTAPAPTATATPALAALCRSYLTRLKKTGFQDLGGKGHRLADEPAYAALVKAAGGEQKVIAHCLMLLSALQRGGEPQGHWPTLLPPGFPTKMPTWPSGRPSWPANRSADHGGN